ncbi:hypothetical protein KIN_05520 [Litoreibacter roseus]|uniref:Uncharacterized protein n=1 Tax=Litoreibacter roseus TaxID=2601869 RepID=A0A6N6JDW4_9RHOB|nr:hypothetical protein KIN_05520 [Litoreibacter roseus]
MFKNPNVVRGLAVLIAVVVLGPTIFFLLRYLAFPNWGNTELNIGFIVWVLAVFIAERRLSKLWKSN